MRLAIVYDRADDIPATYVEFSEQQFKEILLAEYEKVNSVTRAFERTCHLLKRKAGEV